MVSLELISEECAKQIFDSINKGLKKIGLEPYTDREEVEAVINIIIRRKQNGGGIVGRTSKQHMMRAVLEFLTDADIITPEFGEAVYTYWMLEPHDTPP